MEIYKIIIGDVSVPILHHDFHMVVLPSRYCYQLIQQGKSYTSSRKALKYIGALLQYCDSVIFHSQGKYNSIVNSISKENIDEFCQFSFETRQKKVSVSYVLRDFCNWMSDGNNLID